VGSDSTPATVPLVPLAAMRLTHFRELMAEEFGRVRSEMISRDHVFSAFGHRTVNQALSAGYDPKDIWLAVCEAFDVPPERR